MTRREKGVTRVERRATGAGTQIRSWPFMRLTEVEAILRDAPIHFTLYFLHMFQDQNYFAVETAYLMDEISTRSWMEHIYANLAAIDENDSEMTTY